MEQTTDIKPLINDKSRLTSLLNDIPHEPGCYLMKNYYDHVLYVGKSKNLKNRVRSYFNNNRHTPRISLMLRQVVHIELIITDNESESLTLESNLIKAHQPYYNVLLKDDKKYPYICITWGDDYPRIYITRRRRNRKPKDRYYGPYVDVNLLRQTLFSIKKLFPLRQRPVPLYKDRTCLNYSIDRCPGVCQRKISTSDYKKTIKKVEMIFQGRSDELKNLLVKHMTILSEQQEFEKAISLREQIKGLDRLYESQKMIVPDSSICRDIISYSSNKTHIAIQIFQMRSGKLVGRLGYLSNKDGENESLMLQKVVEQHYCNVDPVEIPTEILVKIKLPNSNYISDWLSELKQQKVVINVPKRSSKAELIRLVERNASYELDQNAKSNDLARQSMEDLTELLDLHKLPKRIEGYDISHCQGSDAVGSQVVFINAMPAKQHYRKYIIKNEKVEIGHSDDYQSLSEVINRRFTRWSKLKKEYGDLSICLSKKSTILDPGFINDWPDLVLIDGGKGQLNAVMKTLKKLDLDSDLCVISLAKKNEDLYMPGIVKPLKSDKLQPGIILLRKLRDESHRFAISFHRKRRGDRMTRSQLSEIPGVGPKRIKSLLNHFNSIDSIHMASVKEISSVPGVGKSCAETVWQYFHTKTI